MNEGLFKLLDDAHALLLDHPKQIQDLIYWACTLDDEARAMLIMAYRNLHEEEMKSAGIDLETIEGDYAENYHYMQKIWNKVNIDKKFYE